MQKVFVCGTRTVPTRLRLQRWKPRVWSIRERPLYGQAFPHRLPPEDARRFPNHGRLRGCRFSEGEVVRADLKARVVTRAAWSEGYRPSLIEAVKNQPDRLPVDVDAVVDWLAPEDPPGRLYGLSELLRPMSLGLLPDDDADVKGDHNVSMGRDHLRPRSGPVRDMMLNGHGVKVGDWRTMDRAQGIGVDDDKRPPKPRCCRICGAPIGDGSYRYCSNECRKVGDSRRHRVFRPDRGLVEFVRDRVDLDDTRIAIMCGVSQKKIQRIMRNLPDFEP